MTAIAIGKLPIATVVVADSLVQIDPKSIGHKHCRVEDKIYHVESSDQYVTLIGEQVLITCINILDAWLSKKRKKLDLMNNQHFNELLLLANKHREIVQKIGKEKLPHQESSFLYIVSKNQIKEYEIACNNEKYEVKSERFINDNELIISYKGNKKIVKPIGWEIEEVFEKAKQEILKEHEYRKNIGFKEGKTPLNHDFNDKFSAVIIPYDEELPVLRHYPDQELTDFYLSWWPEWDAILDSKFRWSPKIEFPDI